MGFKWDLTEFSICANECGDKEMVDAMTAYILLAYVVYSMILLSHIVSWCKIWGNLRSKF